MRQHTLNDSGFICGWYLEETSICDAIIDFHKHNKNKHPGKINAGEINKTIKDSTDCTLDENPIMYNLYVERVLRPVLDNYISKYPFCNNGYPFSVIQKIGVQHYAPGQGYHHWHCERMTPISPASTRHLVFMTYLNDVTDGGETYFFHQDVKIKPQKGLTLVWPADWTHTHKGIVSPTQDKYIVTGWFNYMDDSQ